jgi:hypothetical protein
MQMQVLSRLIERHKNAFRYGSAVNLNAEKVAKEDESIAAAAIMAADPKEIDYGADAALPIAAGFEIAMSNILDNFDANF